MLPDAYSSSKKTGNANSTLNIDKFKIVIKSLHQICNNNLKILSVTDKREYEKKPDHYCDPSEKMGSTNASDADMECTANPSCHMFFDWKGAGYRFYACDNTGKAEASKVGSVLYQKLNGKYIHIYEM